MFCFPQLIMWNLTLLAVYIDIRAYIYLVCVTII